MRLALKIANSRRLVLACALVCSAPIAPGCVELGLIPPPDDDGNIPDDGNGGGNGNGGDDELLPRVQLTVSNVTPQVDEEVMLRCRLLNDPPEPVEFDFQPSGGPIGRFEVDSQGGTASFIVQQPDVGVAVSVRCTGSNDRGTGPPSNAQVIVATSPEPLVAPP